MRLRTVHLLAFLTIALTMSNCKKDKTAEPEPSPSTGGSTSSMNTMAELFSTNGVQIQTAQTTTAAAQTINSSSFRLSVPANGFVVASTGASVTGTIDLSLKPIITKKDIILTGAPGNASGKLVATRGCIKVNATQNGQVLRMAPGNPISVQLPLGQTIPAGAVFKKYYAASMSTTDSSKCWKLAADSAALTPIFDTATMQYSCTMNLDSLSWLNVGYEWDTIAPKTSVICTVDTSMFHSTNCAVYISIDGTMAVGSLYNVNGAYYRINNIPIGRSVTLVAIAVINGQYYYKVYPVQITSNFTTQLNLTATTLQQLENALLLLP
jgi:hypothetical protein